MARPPLSLEMAALLLRSPADQIVDGLIEHSRALTHAIHGRSIVLRGPCYISSFCANECVYCNKPVHSRSENGGQIPSVWLSPARVRHELEGLARHGLKRVLLVTGESSAITNRESVASAIAAARAVVPEIDVLTMPAEVADYESWKSVGAQGVVCYQETYDPLVYSSVHPRGPKTHYHDRLVTPERVGTAGMARLEIGVLLGLSDPSLDLLTLIAHARFLSRQFPRMHITLGLPRAVRRAAFQPAHVIQDLDLLRNYAVLRLALPEAGLVVTSREPKWLRGRLLACATELSARPPHVQEAQIECAHDGGAFEIMDWRSAEELRWEIEDLGYGVGPESVAP